MEKIVKMLFLIIQIIELDLLTDLQNLCLERFKIRLKNFTLVEFDHEGEKEEEASAYRSKTFHPYETYLMASDQQPLT